MMTLTRSASPVRSPFAHTQNYVRNDFGEQQQLLRESDGPVRPSLKSVMMFARCFRPFERRQRRLD